MSVETLMRNVYGVKNSRIYMGRLILHKGAITLSKKLVVRESITIF